MKTVLIVYFSTIFAGGLVVAALARTPIDALLLGLPLGLGAIVMALALSQKD